MFFLGIFGSTLINKWTVDTQIAVLLFSHAKQIPSSPRARLLSALQAGHLRLRRYTPTQKDSSKASEWTRRRWHESSEQCTRETGSEYTEHPQHEYWRYYRTHRLLKAWFVCQRPAGNVHQFRSRLQFSMLRLMMSFPEICWSCFSILEGHNPSVSHSTGMTCLCSSNPVSPCVLYI